MTAEMATPRATADRSGNQNLPLIRLVDGSARPARECSIYRITNFGQEPKPRHPIWRFTLGFDADLDRAAEMAMTGMLQLLEEPYQLHRKDALALASVVVDGAGDTAYQRRARRACPASV